MKIGKYTKLKSNKYSVVIDDITVKLYDDVIVKYELLRLKEIDDKLFKEITEYNDRLEAFYKSLKYITKKLRTETKEKAALEDVKEDITETLASEYLAENSVAAVKALQEIRKDYELEIVDSELKSQYAAYMQNLLNYAIEQDNKADTATEQK